MNLQKKLENLKGKSWMFNSNIHEVLQFKIEDDNFIIVTNKSWLTFPIKDAREVLMEFLPVENDKQIEESTTAPVSISLAIDIPVRDLSSSLKTVISQLNSRDTISPAEMKKMEQLNKTAQTIINLGKLQLDYFRISNAIEKK